MQINITGHQVDLTEALNEYAHTKIEKLQRHFDSITNVQVTLSVEKNRHIAEANLHLSGKEIFASDEQEHMYAAIDGLSDKLDRQIIRYKEKLKSHK